MRLHRRVCLRAQPARTADAGTREPQVSDSALNPDTYRTIRPLHNSDCSTSAFPPNNPGLSSPRSYRDRPVSPPLPPGTRFRLKNGHVPHHLSQGPDHSSPRLGHTFGVSAHTLLGRSQHRRSSSIATFDVEYSTLTLANNSSSGWAGDHLEAFRDRFSTYSTKCC